MDRNQLEKRIVDFLSSSSDQKVLLIKGDWGVGKSFFLEEVIKNWGANGNEKVAIASLFGVSEFGQAMDRLYFPLENSGSEWSSIFLWASKIRRFFPSNVPTGVGVNVNLDTMYQSALSFILNNGVFVLDDVERKNAELDLKKVLGIVSYLAEKKLKKLIIVLSEKNLEPSDLKQINELREKVVDLEYTFAPSPKDNAKLVLTDPEEIEIIQGLGINNIRLIKKIKIAWKELMQSASFKLKDARVNAKQRIAALCIIHLDKSIPFGLGDVPSQIDWIVREDPENKKNSEILDRLGYFFDKGDFPIFDFLRHGDYDKVAWQSRIDTLEEGFQSQELKKERTKAWDLFNSNFSVPYVDVVKGFEAFMNKSAGELYPGQVLESMHMLNGIGYDCSSKEWLDLSVTRWAHTLNAHDALSLKDKVRSVEVKKLLEDRIVAETYEVDLEKAIRRVVENGGWREQDTLMISNASVADYKKWFAGDRSYDLLPLLRSAYRMFLQWDEGYKESAKRMRQAAVEMANDMPNGDGKLNLLRIQTFLGA